MLPAIFPLILVACSSAAFTLANLPTHFEEITVVRDRVYGPNSSHLLDLCTSVQKPSQPREVIVFFSGGRWTEGTQNDYRFVGATLADRGYLVVIPDYRKNPDIHFPTVVKDPARAADGAQNHLTEWHSEPLRIHVVRHSAGAPIGWSDAPADAY
ncbi:MAG: alpha/beta hydrolase [Nitrospira sp.]|nr:alpha/beta hydrolase [Nitrospira sp.]